MGVGMAGYVFAAVRATFHAAESHRYPMSLQAKLKLLDLPPEDSICLICCSRTRTMPPPPPPSSCDLTPASSLPLLSNSSRSPSALPRGFHSYHTRAPPSSWLPSISIFPRSAASLYMSKCSPSARRRRLAITTPGAQYRRSEELMGEPNEVDVDEGVARKGRAIRLATFVSAIGEEGGGDMDENNLLLLLLHVKEWREEIRGVMSGEEESEKREKNWGDMTWLQAQIDKRCVENMRMLVVDSVQHAKAGHPGLPLGMTEVGYVLYRKAMRYNPRNPSWFNRDRFVLSAGHGCLLQYICLHLAGFQSVQIQDLKKLCQLGSHTPGHPENMVTAGVEVTTGPLGQGVANAVGLAIAEKHLAGRFNKEGCTIVDHRTFCIMGDGCAMEGISNEAASLAGHLKLNKLIVIYDDNHNTIDGDTSLTFTEDTSLRFQALGWKTIEVEGIYDDLPNFEMALDEAFNEQERPIFIEVKSRIGRLSKYEGSSKAHHGIFDEDDVRRMRKAARWDDNQEPFHVLPMVYREFQRQAEHGRELEEEWNRDLAEYRQKYPREGAEFTQLLSKSMPDGWEKILPTWSVKDPPDSSRSYSEKCLNALASVLPGIIGGSADLASSNKVYLKGYEDFNARTPWGRNIRYGVREHAMAGISNGIALHGSGLIPYAATFLVFSDYMKNAMRLSALSHAGVVYVCTHDSIGLGEDGPTHQPVEQLVGLRAIPNMAVLRPADGKEVAGAYRVAIRRRRSPTVIALSRQVVGSNLEGTSEDKVPTGGYVVSDNGQVNDGIDLILIGTGSEVGLCERAAEVLRKENKRRRIRVVSLVSWELFQEQSRQYKDSVLPPLALCRISVEAGSTLGWTAFTGTGPSACVVGVDSFGTSGAFPDVFASYGFTVDNILHTARRLLLLP